MIDFTANELFTLLLVGALPLLAVWWIVRLVRGIDGAKQAWHDELRG